MCLLVILGYAYTADIAHCPLVRSLGDIGELGSVLYFQSHIGQIINYTHWTIVQKDKESCSDIVNLSVSCLKSSGLVKAQIFFHYSNSAYRLCGFL